MMPLNVILLATIQFLPCATFDFSTEKSANWHHWRGPNANGTAPLADPPIHWDLQTGKNVRWKAPLVGQGSATPIVWGDRVFVITAVKTDRIAKPEELPKLDSKLEKKTEAPKNFYRFLVLCFDRNSGKLLWQRQAAERVPHEGHHQTHSYAAGSPTTDGKFFYVSFGSFGIYCYDFDGNLRWQRDLGLIQSRLGWGEAVTPVLHQGCLLLNWDQEENSALFCLEAVTGQTRWKAERDEKTSWNTPLVVEHQGKTQIIINGTNRIRAHDFETGQVLWSCGGMTVNAIPSPILVGDTVVCMSGYRSSMAVAIPLDSRGDLGTEGKVRWRYDKGTPYVPSPVLVGDRLYFTDRNEALLSILNAKTGAVILDRARLSAASSFYASPIAAAGRIYLVDRNGTTLVQKQSDQLDILAANKLDDPIDASPVAVGKQLFLRGEKYLYCLEEAQGTR